MTCTTLAPSYCWHCHTPLEHQAQGAHTPFRSEAVAACPTCSSTYKITAVMQAITGPAVSTSLDLRSAPASKFERGAYQIPRGGL